MYTVGHSVHSETHFVSLLTAHDVSAICDVRSVPYSRRNPQFNKEIIANSLKNNGIAYVFMGKELGAKDPGAECCVSGKVQFDLIARSENFRTGLDRVRNGIKQHVVALMCAEEDPLNCHRTILVCRHLRNRVESILHIRGDGNLETNESFEIRLLDHAGVEKDDLFDSEASAIDRAYHVHGQRISYEFPDA